MKSNISLMLIDFSNIAYMELFSLARDKNFDLEQNKNLLKHTILNKIRFTLNRFKKYNVVEVVLAIDSKHSWRKDVFPNYKIKRKKFRDDSNVDFDKFFEIMNEFYLELKENFPYKVIQVDGAEGDDIIATLTIHFHDNFDNIIIVSRDKDYKQLLKFNNVILHDPFNNKNVDEEDPIKFLKYHILKGDAGDGIPNVKSDDNVFADGIRQTACGDKFILPLIEKSESSIKEKMKKLGLLKNYNRNKRLISLYHIPDNIKEEILNVYYIQKPVKNVMKLLSYFTKNRFRNLGEHYQDFILGKKKKSLF